MKHLLILFVVLVVSILSVQQIAAQSGSEDVSYTLVVVSSADPAAKVRFSGAYVAYDPDDHPDLHYIKEVTPYEMRVSGSVYLGMFHALSEMDRVRVTLTRYADGVLTGHAVGTSTLNFVHGGDDGIGYGLPSGFSSTVGQFKNLK